MTITSAAANDPFKIFVTPPIRDSQPAPDRIPGQDPSNQVHLSACPGEYEPASFSVFAAEDLKNVTLEVSPLSSGAETIPSDAVDIRVVKWWYQTGRGGTPGIEARRHRH